MEELSVIIPTYWTWPLDESDRPVIAAFDHPTPLDGESTLPRLLDDLAEQHFKDFKVVVLTGLRHSDLGQAVADRLSSLIKPYQSRLDFVVCDGLRWSRLKTAMENEALPTNGLNLGSYSGVRNLQLLIPHILEAKIIVALDDDERVEPDYLERAKARIGQLIGQKPVLGLAGPYLQEDGSAYLSGQDLSGNVFLDKGYYINKAMQMLMNNKGTLTYSPMALGGNMLFHHDCFSKVPFDPGITRGEDIDYLINARLQGIEWWFDAELTILHLPPKHYETPRYQRMREDVIRFVYEREKLRSYGVNQPIWLDPYPGALLMENLVEQARLALENERTSDLAARYGEPDEIIGQARAHAAFYVPRYQPYVEAWTGLMARIEEDNALRNKLYKPFKVKNDL